MSTSPHQLCTSNSLRRTTSFAPICETCVHTIPSCYDMSPSEKSSIWYSYSEINFFKNAAKFVGSVFRSTKHVNENDIDKILKLQSSRSLKDNLFVKFLMSYYPEVNPDCVKTDALHYCPRGIESRIFPDRKSEKEGFLRAIVKLTSKNILRVSPDSQCWENVLECSKRATDIALASAALDEFYASLSYGSENSFSKIDACTSLLTLMPLSQRPNYPIQAQFRLMQGKIDWRIHQLSTFGKRQEEDEHKRKMICREDFRRLNHIDILHRPRGQEEELSAQ